MGRKPRFSTDDILDAALELIADGGPGAATAASVARSIGAPSGSLYHRFAGRDEMLARLWLRTIARYQRGLTEALQLDDVEAAAHAAVAHCFDWTAAHPGETRVLLQYSKDDLVAEWPDTLAGELADLNGAALHVLRDYARRRVGSDDREAMDRVLFALVELPYAAVRRHLPDRGQPAEWLRDFTIRSADDILRDAAAQTSADS